MLRVSRQVALFVRIEDEVEELLLREWLLSPAMLDRAIAQLLDGILQEEASWDAFFEHCGISPILVLYENFAADYETSTVRVLERLGLSLPEAFAFEPRMKRQSDGINDDWARRFSELRLGTQFDLVPTVRTAATPVR